MVNKNNLNENLLLSCVFFVTCIVAVVLVMGGCKPEDVAVKRTPDTASSVANIQNSQFEQVVPFPKPKPVPPREPMASVEQSELAEEIASNADLVISRFGILANVKLGCNEDGVRWLSHYIDSKHEVWSPHTVNSLVDTLGSYFGECVRTQYGGQWYKVDGQVELRIDTSRSTYPFELIRNHIEKGKSESIMGSYQKLSQTLESLSGSDEQSN